MKAPWYFVSDARGLVLYARRVWLWWVVAKILTGRAWQRVREARR